MKNPSAKLICSSHAPRGNARPGRSSSLLLISVLTLTGCGGRYVPVEGTVTLDGKPLGQASVVFTPVNIGQPASALTDEAGFFRLRTVKPDDGALPGRYKVTIIKTATGARPTGYGASTTLDPTELDETIRQVEQQQRLAPEVHPDYGDANKTPFNVEIPEDGKRDFEFAVQRTPPS